MRGQAPRLSRRLFPVWSAGTAVADETTESDGDCPGDEDSGLVTVASDDDFDETVCRITEAIEARENLSVVTTVDHAANAETADLDLPPTTLVVFGNPAVGTRLMQSSRSVAIDLLQKLLIWEAENGTVNVTYNDPQRLADRHGIEDRDELLGNVASLLRGIATGDAGTPSAEKAED